MADRAKKHIIVAAGGTGGHVYPAIAIADALRALSPELSISFVGTSTHMEWKAVPKAGYSIDAIWVSGFQRRFTLKNFLFPFKLLVSIIQSHILLKRYQPIAVICAGGYVSGPVGYTAHLKKLPLYLQEQNSYPGVANRMLAGYANRVFTAFEEAKKWFEDTEVHNLGNPVRSVLASVDRKSALEVFNFAPNRPTLLIIGGSLGARSINQALLEHIAELHDRLGLQIIWQCGKLYEAKIREQLDVQAYSDLRLMSFIDDMPSAYSAADLILSRAGASSLSEIQNMGKVSILVPSPNVAGNHQYFNAKAMQDADAALLLADADLKKDLVPTIRKVLDQPSKMQRMADRVQNLAKPKAAEQIAAMILSDLEIPIKQSA